MRPKWIANHASFGEVEIIPQSIRYYKNESLYHYGWEVGYWATVKLSNGLKKKSFFRGIGADRKSAMDDSKMLYSDQNRVGLI